TLFQDELERLSAVFCLTHNAQIAFDFQQCSESAQHHPLVFGNYHAHAHDFSKGSVINSRVPESTSCFRLPPRASTRILTPERPTPSTPATPQPLSLISSLHAPLFWRRTNSHVLALACRITLVTASRKASASTPS